MVRRSICKCFTCEHQLAFACRAFLATNGRVQLPAEKRTGPGKQYTTIHGRLRCLDRSDRSWNRAQQTDDKPLGTSCRRRVAGRELR